MLELKGKYATAVCYTDYIEASAQTQLVTLCNQSFTENAHIRIMPDVHAGTGCCIGTTMLITDKVVPNLVGVDLGCGVLAVKLVERKIDYAKLDECIHNYVPSGGDIFSSERENASYVDLVKASVANISRAKCSLGTLGGGNHFIEVDRDDEGSLWLVIHTGSRHLGLEIANYYQKQAIEHVRSDATADFITTMKELGREKEISSELPKFKAQFSGIPENLMYCEGQLMQDYLYDVNIAQQFASENRKAIAKAILDNMGLHEAFGGFSSVHNYINTDTHPMILRKGSVAAEKGQKLIIPINMAEGSLICIGKGNSEWNYSAPHGAGRRYSRSAARANLSMEEYQQRMRGIYSTSVCTSTIDESPMAYKGLSEIKSNIKDTVEVVARLKPEYNFKAC